MRAGLPSRPLGYAVVATLGVGIGLAILGAVESLSTVLTYVGLALFLSFAIDPVMTALSHRGVGRGLSTMLLVLVSLISAIGLAFAVIPSATEQVSVVATRIVALVQDLPHQEWFGWLTARLPSTFDLSSVIRSVTKTFDDPQQLIALGGGILRVGNGLVGGITGVVTVSILTIYFVYALPRLKAKAYQFAPLSRRANIAEVGEEILDSVGRYVGGQLVLAAINAAFTFFLTLVVGSPAPALLAVIAFVGALVPVVGTVAGASIAALVTLTVNPAGALVVAVVMLVYMQVEAYVLSPRVMARAVAVPGALVIISALSGAALGGILGALVAVPVAAAGMIIVDRVVLPRQMMT